MRNILHEMWLHISIVSIFVSIASVTISILVAEFNSMSKLTIIFGSLVFAEFTFLAVYFFISSYKKYLYLYKKLEGKNGNK